MIYCNRLVKILLGLGLGLILAFAGQGLVKYHGTQQFQGALGSASAAPNLRNLRDQAQAIDQEIAISDTCPLTSMNAADLIQQGTVSYQKGQFNTAWDCWQTAANRARQSGNRSQQKISEINQAQAMQSLGFHLRACQTLLETFALQNRTCESLTATDLEALFSSPPGLGDLGGHHNAIYQTGLRSLGDVLRSLGYLERSHQLLTHLATSPSSPFPPPSPSSPSPPTSPSFPNQAAILLSLGKTDHAFSKRYQELYNRSGDLEAAIAALETAQSAIAAYQQVIDLSPIDLSPIDQAKTPISAIQVSAIQAQLNQLNLRLALNRWLPTVALPTVPSAIAKPQFNSLRNRAGKRNCQEEENQPAAPAISPRIRFQQIVTAIERTQPPLTNQIRQLQQQMAHYAAEDTSSLSIRLNFAQLLQQFSLAVSSPSHRETRGTSSSLPEASNTNTASPLNPPILGDFQVSPPQNWGARGAKTAATQLQELQQESAHQLAQVAQAAQRQGNVHTEAYALGYLGRLYLQASPPQLKEAQDLTLKALTLARSTQIPDLIYPWEAQLGDIYRQQAKQDPSLVNTSIGMYSAAIATLKSVRSDLLAVDPDIQFTFREDVEPTYRHLIDLLLTSTAEHPSNPDLLKRAVETIDGLQKAELENFLQCSLQVGESTFNLLNLETKPSSEQTQVATIYPILLEERLEMVVQLPTGELRHASTPVPRQRLEQTVKTLRTLLTRQDSPSRQFLSLASNLYTWLIQPLAADLNPSQIKTLVFVPDSLLRNIPMAVLYRPPSGNTPGRYLIQDYAIAVSPGLNLPPSHGTQPKSTRVLMAGLSEQRTIAIRNQCITFNELPSVETELAAIASVLQNREPTEQTQKKRIDQLLNRESGQEFTLANFRQRLQSAAYPVVHLATHGKFSSNPQETYILTADEEPIYVNEFQEMLKGRLNNTSNPSPSDGIELLVLSACETATGDDRAALGIAGVAVRSGASSTLASLWTVDDQSTAQLMQEFYTQLLNPGKNQTSINKTSISKAEALRQAQLALLNTPQSTYRHPNYWAPFILVGNWQ